MKKGISLFFQVLIFVVAVVLIAALSYIIGRPYLIGNSLSGNDTFSFYAVAVWINNYFPNVPFWYPLAGGGVSVVSGYPIFAAYLVAIITRISSLDLVQAFRLLGFLTVPLLAIGVFFLCHLRLPIKSGFTRAILAGLAALFVVVSPNSWLWLTRWGFYAESVSYIFVPWAILFFDLFLENTLEKKRGIGYKIGLVGTVLFVSLAFITHFLSLASLVVFFAVVGLLRFKKNIIVPGLILGVVVFGVLFFKLSSYQYYMNQVVFGGFAGYGRMAYSEMTNNTLPISMWLSLTSPTTIKDPHSLIFDMRFPLYVWILFVVGLIFSIKKSKKIMSFGLYGLFGLILSSVLSLKYFISGIPIFSFIAMLMEDRGFLIIARIIIPVVAVYGAYIFWEIIFSKIIPKLSFIYQSMSVIFALGSIILVTGLFYNYPYKLPFMIGTGVDSGVIDTRDIWNKMPHPSQLLYSKDVGLVKQNPDYQIANFSYMKDICLKTKMTLINNGEICDSYLQNKDLVYPESDLIDKSKAICEAHPIGEKYLFCNAFYSPPREQLKLSNWPKFDISSSISDKEKEVKTIFTSIPVSENFRFDLSGFTGGAVMATPLVTQNSQIQIYINTLSLIYNSWNYQSQVMYSNLTAAQKPGVLTELGKWFGLNYVFLTGSTLEPASYWQSDPNWENIGTWKKFKTPVSLATWDNRPKILVITDVKRGLYDQTFRFATWGAIPFDRFNIITGKRAINSYSLTDLKKYDIVFMRGYSYNSRQSAYNLLDRYVKDGGKLIFDTGWQYETPDYQLSKTPDFMSFDSLVWKNLNTNASFSEVGFGDLKYGDGSWGVSVPQNLKPGAKIDLSYDSQPLVVSSNYGKGKVTWIGFNIVAHAIAKDNQNEALFFNNLITNIVGENSVSNLNIDYKRISPDKVEFDLDSNSDARSGIYFRESHFPYWKATLVSGNKNTNLKIDKSGPGFMTIDLPSVKSGDKVILEIKISFWQKIANLVSIVSVFVVLAYIFKPSVFNKIKLPKFKFKLPKFGTSKDEDKDY